MLPIREPLGKSSVGFVGNTIMKREVRLAKSSVRVVSSVDSSNLGLGEG